MVELEITETGDKLCVKISNTGSEIPPEKQEKIFAKFYQADESHATQGNGITSFTVVLPKKQG